MPQKASGLSSAAEVVCVAGLVNDSTCGADKVKMSDGSTHWVSKQDRRRIGPAAAVHSEMAGV